MIVKELYACFLQKIISKTPFCFCFYLLGVQLKKTNNRGTKASEIAFGPEDVKEYLQ